MHALHSVLHPLSMLSQLDGVGVLLVRRHASTDGGPHASTDRAVAAAYVPAAPRNPATMF